VTTYDTEHQLRVVITQEVRAFVASGGKLKDLAVRSGLTATTISRLAYMETKYPRFHTIIALGKPLGYRLVIQKTPVLVSQRA
jgi:DNA-binding phage protein